MSLVPVAGQTPVALSTATPPEREASPVMKNTFALDDLIGRASELIGPLSDRANVHGEYVRALIELVASFIHGAPESCHAMAAGALHVDSAEW